MHHPDIHKGSALNNILQKLWPFLKHDLTIFLEELSIKVSNLIPSLVLKIYMETFPEKGPTINGVKIVKISDSDKLIKYKLYLDNKNKFITILIFN